jgi:predicted dehydrogenase
MIGSGGNARGHMGQLLHIQGVEIVGICDPDGKALEQAGKDHPKVAKAGKFESHRDLLKEVAMDAVVISTPHVFHFEEIMDSLGKGLHVLCEKPMVCTTEQAVAVLAEVKKTGLVMGVSYQRHFQGAYRYVREQIQSGKHGKVNFVAALQSQNWYTSQVGGKTWRSQMAYACGGQLNDSGSHLLDIILWMVGEPVKGVFAAANNLGAEVDILTAISAEFAGGGLANISIVGHSVNWLEDITVWLDKATFAVRGADVHEWLGGEERVMRAGSDLPGFGNPDINFVAAIRGKEEIQAPPECGLAVIQLTEAAWESAAKGCPVEVK